MSEGTKILGEKRRNLILTWLKESSKPLSGTVLANKTNVSRQVIVQDVSLLKAKGEPIMATARGYVYFTENDQSTKCTRIIAVNHRLKDTALELNTLVDHGVTVKNVMVEHPIYGDLTGSLMIKSRMDVDAFMHELKQTKASLMSKLTDGIHLHTIEADTEDQLDMASQVLRTEGILLES